MKKTLFTLLVIFSGFMVPAQTPATNLAPAAKPKGTRNDLIYPPADAAKAAVNFDGAGFILNGQRTYLSSGSIHYARVPHELWRDRLLRLKQASFAAVETYAFWNFHEPQESKIDFTGDKNLGAFLSTAQALGLYGIMRVGPYVCAEWDSGGYPVWLKFKPPFKVRTDDPTWLAWNRHWYDEVLPIVAQHQINRGGNVVLVQLENEHPLGWGVVTNDAYFNHLREQAVADGLEVPYFMSGLHHGAAPMPENLDSSRRANPWFSTEFWAGWFDAYRTLPEKRYREIDNAIWTILAHGGGGHNFYMLHGGSNFEAWNDDSGGASYDYGSAIGQAGDLRPMYYRMKRANQLAESFPEILANGNDALADNKDFAGGNGIKVLGARQSRSGAGTLVFVQNTAPTENLATLKTGELLKMSRHGVYPLPREVVLALGVKITDSTLPVLSAAHHGSAVTLVVYGQPGETGRLTLSVNGAVKLGSCSKNISADLTVPAQPKLTVKIPPTGVEECSLEQSDRELRVLAVNQHLSLYTWLIGAPGRQYVVCGPAFVQDLQETNGKLSVVIERPYGQPACGQVAVYGGRGQSWHLGAKADTALETQPAPALTQWQMSPTREAEPAFDDSGWKHSDAPLPMGADGDYGAFAWYRTSVQVPAAGWGTLRLQGADNLEIFVNGQPVANDKGVAQADFIAGKNSIAVFTSHNGRKKAYSYMGTLDNYFNKGLDRASTLEIGGAKIDLTGWTLRGGPGANPAAISEWKPLADTGQVPTFYRAKFQAAPPGELGAHPILRVNYAGLTRGTMWVNGHNLGRYPEKIHLDSLYIPECWLLRGENVLTVFDETGASPQRVALQVETAASREVIRVSEPVDADTPITVPAENPVRELAKMNRGNLAFQKPVTASTPASDTTPTLATDGDSESVWRFPADSVNPWLRVDLGQTRELQTCEILWDGPAKYYKYKIEGSIDGQTWTALGDQSTAVPTSPDSPSELSRMNISGSRLRYLRITILAGKSLGVAEIRAFGPEL